MATKRKDPASAVGSPYAKRPRASNGGDFEDDSDAASPSRSTSRPQPRLDPVYGQKHAFPGLDDVEDDSELFYGPAEDGLEYLRMVRSEAKGLPVVFVSQSTAVNVKDGSSVTEHERSEQDERSLAIGIKGFYSDGAYIASPAAPILSDPDAGDEESTKPDPQEQYYNLLHHRFRLLRSTLKCTPSPSAIASLGVLHPISLPRNNKNARSDWRRLVQTVEPQMAQLACMDMESVLNVLGIVARLLSEPLKSDDPIRARRLGAWAWGLLGRCREMGELHSEAVGDLRDFGKRAVKLLVKIREIELRKELEDESNDAGNTPGGYEIDDETIESDNDEEDDIGQIADIAEESNNLKVGPAKGAEDDNVGFDPVLRLDEPLLEDKPVDQDELEAAKARLQAKLGADKDNASATNEDEAESSDGEIDEDEPKDTSAKQYTRVMLDMIITIVGEFYGQRDLLEFRDMWEEEFTDT